MAPSRPDDLTLQPSTSHMAANLMIVRQFRVVTGCLPNAVRMKGLKSP